MISRAKRRRDVIQPSSNPNQKAVLSLTHPIPPNTSQNDPTLSDPNQPRLKNVTHKPIELEGKTGTWMMNPGEIEEDEKGEIVRTKTVLPSHTVEIDKDKTSVDLQVFIRRPI